jgi:hypothetical protein
MSISRPVALVVVRARALNAVLAEALSRKVPTRCHARLIQMRSIMSISAPRPKLN